ncbi:hypothetical protein GCM10009634_47890 [Saccharothrix xinjiangensis]
MSDDGGGDRGAESVERRWPQGGLPCQSQQQKPDRADGPRSAGSPGVGSGSVAAGEEVLVPPQHRVRADQQPESMKRGGWEAVQ